MIGRGVLATFIGLVVLAFAQIAWWMTFLIRIGGERRHLLMFASEGAFFMAALLAGVLIIYRTLVEQVRLRSMRATFLASVTHELKSPLAAIRLFLETLEAGRVPDEGKRQEMFRKMLLDTSRLERLVTDLLRAGQIEAGHLVPALEDVDVVPLAGDVVERARPRLGPDDVLALDATGPVRAPADPGLLRSAIENLVDNAIKYSPPPRAIGVRVEGSRGEVRIEVEDSGAGVDEATTARAFEPFQRGGSEETRAATGAGLGLFIVRGIAEAHGGRAYLGPRGSGRGTVAGILLPGARYPRGAAGLPVQRAGPSR